MTTTQLDPDAAARHERLVDAVRGLRGSRGGDAPRTLAIAGAVLVAAGVALVLLGWAGASRSTDVWEQVPYLISGGLLGLALVFAGGFFYFSSWQSQLVHTARRDGDDTREILETLQRIEALLADQERAR